MQMGALECWGRVEYAPVKPQWKWHFNPRQIQAPCDQGPAQAHPAEINLALQLNTAETQKGGIQPSADTISRAIKSPSFAKRAKKLGYAYCAHPLTPVSHQPCSVVVTSTIRDTACHNDLAPDLPWIGRTRPPLVKAIGELQLRFGRTALDDRQRIA
jgi:hypothetical protein